MNTTLERAFQDQALRHLDTLYATALRLLRPLGNRGDAWAQNRLGSMYYLGRGVPHDYAQAVKWYRLAAGQGYASPASAKTAGSRLAAAREGDKEAPLPTGQPPTLIARLAMRPLFTTGES